MAASMIVEEESGTISGRVRHPHNGYYAGDFTTHTQLQPAAWLAPIPKFDAH